MKELHSGRQRGFSMVELLVAIVLAGIIFAAMVPVFATALKKTSGDNLRNVAANIAQDRIEQVRLLSYNSITQDNLRTPPADFGDRRFGPIYTVVGTNVPFNILYTVDPAANTTPQAAQKKITVQVTRAGLTYTTIMTTLVKNPDAGVSTSVSTSPSPSPTITGLSITASFKNYTQVTAATGGVTVQRVQTNVTPNITYSPTPYPQVPNASSTTVAWTNLTGGMAFTYTVTCHSIYINATSPPFHLLKSARLKFDTHPGGT